ncbi:MAG: YitT family protein [Acidobacteriota bacterium]|nr:YitT family protein [Thermoanaerobaculaceae bacterium]
MYLALKRFAHLKKYKALEDYLELTAGSLVVALGVAMFLLPNKVISAGVTGIAMILEILFKFPTGTANFILNIPLLLMGIKWGGGFKVLFRTIYAVFVMSLGIDLFTAIIPPVTGDPFVYCLFGGLLDGIGIGLVLRAQGTTGGTDIIAQLLYRYQRISFASTFLFSNTVILLAAIPIVGIVPILYALVVNYISSRILDTVQEGLGYSRAVYVVTEKVDKLKEAIINELDRGLTIFEATGGFSGKPKPVLYVVVSRSQISRLKRIIAETDEDAFVVVTEAHEVLGEGFKPISEN